MNREQLKRRIRQKLYEMRKKRRLFEENDIPEEDLPEEPVEDLGSDSESLISRARDILDKYADVLEPEDAAELESIIGKLPAGEGDSDLDVEDEYEDEYEEEPIEERWSHRRRFTEGRKRKVVLTEAQKRRIRRKIQEAIERINRREKRKRYK
jgi:hypothetical protein